MSWPTDTAGTLIKHAASYPLIIKNPDVSYYESTIVYHLDTYCSCGEKLLYGWNFCPQCGKRLTALNTDEVHIQ